MKGFTARWGFQKQIRDCRRLIDEHSAFGLGARRFAKRVVIMVACDNAVGVAPTLCRRDGLICRPEGDRFRHVTCW